MPITESLRLFFIAVASYSYILQINEDAFK